MTRIAIVGAGFSGTALAIQLLRAGGADLDVHLFNRSGAQARGLAYGTRSPRHVLNVPAGRMGLFPDAEHDFLVFLETRRPGTGSGEFVARSLYGDYLEQRLAEAEAASAARLHRHAEDVRALEPAPAAWRLRHGAGELAVHHAVLATGNFAPATPKPLEPYTDHPAYVRDPWASGALAGIAPATPVLLLGTGLTMYDVALALDAQGHRGPMLALSRRGLTPRPHREHSQAPALPPLPETLFSERRIRPLLAGLRAYAAEIERGGGDWRDALAALREATPRLWRQLELAEQRRFLRHAQAYWDVHRHRAAPAIADAIAALVAEDRLRIAAGRLLAVLPERGGLRLEYRPRRDPGSCAWFAGAVINCTGPDSDVRRLRDPLMAQLLAAGYIRPDALGLGLDADDAGALRNRNGDAQQGFYLLGPMLKARDWECTAVPELRQQAARLAARLLEAVR